MTRRELNDNNWRFTESLMNAAGEVTFEKPLKAKPFDLEGGRFEDHPDADRDRMPLMGYVHRSSLL